MDNNNENGFESGQPNGESPLGYGGVSGSSYSQPQSKYGGTNGYEQSNYGGANGYGQSNYGGTNGYEQQGYGQPYYGGYRQQGYSRQPLDENGNPLKNRFGMKLTFSILEIISCNLVALVCGIVGCVYTAKANTAYKEWRWDDFRSNAKAATISLWIGFAGFIVGLILEIILIVAMVAAGISLSEAMESDSLTDYLENPSNWEYETGDDDDTDDDTDWAQGGDDAGLTQDGDTDSDLDHSAQDGITTIPSVGEAASGEGYSSAGMTLNGWQITLPVKYAEFAQSGYTISDEDAQKILEAATDTSYRYADSIDLYNEDGDWVGCVDICNFQYEAAALEDCTVFGVTLLCSEYGAEWGYPEFVFENGVTNASTVEDYLTAFGEPDDVSDYGTDSGDDYEYIWYYNDPMYEQSDTDALMINVWNGEINDVTIRHVGRDYE